MFIVVTLAVEAGSLIQVPGHRQCDHAHCRGVSRAGGTVRRSDAGVAPPVPPDRQAHLNSRRSLPQSVDWLLQAGIAAASTTAFGYTDGVSAA